MSYWLTLVLAFLQGSAIGIDLKRQELAQSGDAER
ncbi:hypothetical protein J3996_gp72 [Mycobacterium phage Laurie]|uniref:Uncharacterized protein n=1 Tax=Mycobacterium phage Laurie TaxID=1874015 RepID=A0A1B2IHP6_9CAUD|nr:hypothetical protein J3996_gp72 [Mycobacterium phage Laurie]ANZ52366.1 hypothetical protein SEA_LAURIE_72 [Mycobacterium phage Laurie]